MLRWTTTVAMVFLATACADGPAAPTTMSVATAASPSSLLGLGSESATFTIVPGVPATIPLGRFTLYLPANALCDVASSGYGRTMWNQDCALETSPQRFTATWQSRDGAASISFDRDVRFRPGAKVYLTLKAVGQVKKSEALLWYDPSAGAWVDEGTYDPDMMTYRANGGTLLWRRLKHFSGYNVGAGENCDPLTDPNCGGGSIELPSLGLGLGL